MRISLTALRAFEATARHSSMSMAAAELRVGLASISRHVSALQARLGVELLRREGRRVALTPAGRAYFAEITAAFRNINTATDSIARDRGQRGPRLVIACDRGFAFRWLLRRLSGFTTGVPGLDLHLIGPDDNEGDALPDIRLTWRAAAAEPAAEEVRLCDPPVFPVSSLPTPATLTATLRSVPLIHTRSQLLWREWLHHHGHTGDLPRGGLVVPDKALALTAACEGLGVALACGILAGDDIAAGRCHRVLEHAYVLGGYVASLQPRPSSDPVLIDRFLAWLRDEMAASTRAPEIAGLQPA